MTQPDWLMKMWDHLETKHTDKRYVSQDYHMLKAWVGMATNCH